MSNKFKYIVWKYLNILGIDVYPSDYRNSLQSYLKYLLSTRNINEVVDIGANEGQYGLVLRNIGYKGKITSYEPLPSAWKILKDISKNDSNWDIHDRVAVVDKDNLDFIDIYETTNSVSSSILKPQEANEFKIKNKIQSKTIEINTLIEKHSENSLLKFDVQGYETTLLKSINFQKKCQKFIQLELAIEPTYEGEKLFDEAFKILSSNQYKLIYIFPGVANDMGQLIQIECIFEKE